MTDEITQEPSGVHVRPNPICLAHWTSPLCPCQPIVKVRRDLYTHERYRVFEHRSWDEVPGALRIALA